MDIESKIGLIKQVGEEIITEEELKHLLQTEEHPIAYDGFEPSGTDIHIAQGILRAININRMAKAGIKFKMLVADWHAWANNKMSGDLEKIQLVGKYLIEVWQKCGMDLKNVEFVWVSDYVKEPE
ncbi:tyrosine--tRNA ligase, partial [Candidatus Woesearchaeota archaeon]|nr:tyrosine--tRNA ligase [Candidatus Woesearchaeota archaeon]